MSVEKGRGAETMIGQEQLHHPAVDIWGSGAIHCLTFTRTMRFPLSVWRCGPASLFGPVLAPLTPPHLVVCNTATAVLQPRKVPGKESKDDRDVGSSGPSWLVPRPLLGTDPFSGPPGQPTQLPAQNVLKKKPYRRLARREHPVSSFHVAENDHTGNGQ
ncbi:hypothetical protein MYCTH_2122175 [Thermothelomyces thermophilus ATCC 42464]|uniref:Uncharacterized protein n=1 Tax=Thermothelomyces thermophilus (strain ATCC 42464 / BCRC 31852 / DSM 1799) TaxID=573729 RepID=G2Q1P4_THET4|nr:uncharacterized protein MYCTH_2122175 [Thermothelomyces thermophilus ATCC 42464]AEO53328.1 hypothetical protein MYCTH_2122175 [Thermothelomyces thermophilus ATCC 42464]